MKKTAWHTDSAIGPEKETLVLLVPAINLFWPLRDRSVDPTVVSGPHSSSSKPIGIFTLSHVNVLPSLASGGRGGTDLLLSENQDRTK